MMVSGLIFMSVITSQLLRSITRAKLGDSSHVPWPVVLNTSNHIKAVLSMAGYLIHCLKSGAKKEDILCCHDDIT